MTNSMLAVGKAQMDGTGVCGESRYAARVRARVRVCVVGPDCVGTDAVAPTYAAIILSLFQFSAVGRSIDAIITSNRMDHGRKRANGGAALGGKCVITSPLMAIDRRRACACESP